MIDSRHLNTTSVTTSKADQTYYRYNSRLVVTTKGRLEIYPLPKRPPTNYYYFHQKSLLYN